MRERDTIQLFCCFVLILALMLHVVFQAYFQGIWWVCQSISLRFVLFLQLMLIIVIFDWLVLWAFCDSSLCWFSSLDFLFKVELILPYFLPKKHKTKKQERATSESQTSYIHVNYNVNNLMWASSVCFLSRYASGLQGVQILKEIHTDAPGLCCKESCKQTVVMIIHYIIH